MNKQGSNKIISYQEYLKSLNKNDLIYVLNLYHIPYKRNQKKQIYEELILENVDNIAKKTLHLFQMDEFYNLKFIIKKKGKLTVKFNHLLLAFLQNLVRNHLLIAVSDNTFQMPTEILLALKKEIKNKNVNKVIQKNTEEYNLIQGFIDAYGVIDFEWFYNEYSKIYKLSKEDTLERLNDLATFYLEFNLFNDKKKNYLASKIITSLKEAKKYVNKSGEYAIYTNEELINIHTFKYMESFKSYKKLKKFINRNYDVNKGSFKIINKYVLIPFMTNRQCDIEKAKEILSMLIDKYFEFNKQKNKNKLIDLIEKVAMDYPCWNLKGHRERE